MPYLLGLFWRRSSHAHESVAQSLGKPPAILTVTLLCPSPPCNRGSLISVAKAVCFHRIEMEIFLLPSVLIHVCPSWEKEYLSLVDTQFLGTSKLPALSLWPPSSKLRIQKICWILISSLGTWDLPSPVLPFDLISFFIFIFLIVLIMFYFNESLQM